MELQGLTITGNGHDQELYM